MITRNYTKPEPKVEDRIKVHELALQGYVQVSRKYRRLARVPGGKGNAINWIKDHDLKLFEEITAKIILRMETECASYLLSMKPETVELTPEEFEAWLQEGLSPWGRIINESNIDK
jgi:hypothetical protein